MASPGSSALSQALRPAGADDQLRGADGVAVHQDVRTEGVSLQTIRRASRTASEQFHTDYPFAFMRFDTDGATIFATLLHEDNERSAIEDLEKGQYIFEQVVKPFFRRIEYRRQAEATRY